VKGKFWLVATSFESWNRSLPGAISLIKRWTMPEGQTKGRDIDPRCVKCGSKMRFSCTEPEPDKPGFVHHVYECTKCRSTQSFVTPI
jgi:hypothetical protein